MSVIAKGARSAKNKFGSSLDPLSHSSIQIYKQPNKDLHLLSKSETISQLRHIHNSLEHLSYGLSAVETVLQTQHENHPSPEIFDLLLNTLQQLELLQENPFSNFLAFQLELIKILGFEINFSDIHALNDNSKYIVVSLEDGSFSNETNDYKKNTFRLHYSTVEILVAIADKQIDIVHTVNIGEENKSEIIKFLIHYFCYHLEKSFSFKSLSLLKY